MKLKLIEILKSNTHLIDSIIDLIVNKFYEITPLNIMSDFQESNMGFSEFEKEMNIVSDPQRKKNVNYSCVMIQQKNMLQKSYFTSIPQISIHQSAAVFFVCLMCFL